MHQVLMYFILFGVISIKDKNNSYKKTKISKHLADYLTQIF